MKVFEGIIPNCENLKELNNLQIENSVFFDIETTGFSYTNTSIYLIGVIYYKKEINSFSYIQWFIDNVNEEAELIYTFFNFIKRSKFLIHFNGDGFDIPYLKGKCRVYNIIDEFSNYNSIDLYKEANFLKKFLKTPNLKQKTIEDFFDLKRIDIYSGGDLINFYNEYKKTADSSILDILLLHNLEDIKGLLTVINLYFYIDIFRGSFIVDKISINKKLSYEKDEAYEFIAELILDNPIEKRISYGNTVYYFSASGKTAKIKVEVYTNELKFFYPNYKDYYYLPAEDTSIHKSVAFYVDKNFRTRAKAANCYSKKTGRFLPQHGEIISPFFKIEYNDKTTYFELTDEFLNDPSLVKSYLLHVLSYIRII